MEKEEWAMWTRQELKEKGRTAFRDNYWRCVVAGVVVLILTGGSAATARGDSSDWAAWQDQLGYLTAQSRTSVFTMLGLLMGILGLSLLMGLALRIFLCNPMKVGASRFFLCNSREPASLHELGYAFSGRYGKVVTTVFLTDLFTFLWSLLLLIPGIVKSYAYLMVPYILADDSDMDPMEAIGLSEQMMQGQKWNAFVLELSFLGWHILSSFTLGILEIFYVRPYVEATRAELYRKLKQSQNTRT